MLITSKGQITIPAWIRREKGFLPHTEVEFDVVHDEVRIVKVEGKRRRASGLLRHLKGQASARLSTDEIMALTRGEE